jgi:hypothetical protein
MQRIINYLLGDKPNFVQSVERKALTDWQSNPNQVEIYDLLYKLEFYYDYLRDLQSKETIDNNRVGLSSLQSITENVKVQIREYNKQLTELTNNR